MSHGLTSCTAGKDRSLVSGDVDMAADRCERRQ